MQKTLMVGLNEKDMQAVVNTYNLNNLYYPTLFPLKQNYTLEWKTLAGQIGLRIAADLVARGASIDAKTREAIARLQGDIPKIAIKRIKDENELNDYQIMLARTSGNPDLRALVDAWAEDTQYCWDGVANRLEWIALTSISLGKVTLTNDNNNSVISEYDVDYAIPSTRKLGYNADSAAWGTSASAKPITKDFRSIVSAAKKQGITLKYAFMSQDTFAAFAETAEVIKLCASFAANALGIQQTPTLDQVNTTMNGLAYLYGLQIVVIDQQITVEKTDGTRVSGNPFTQNVVMFSESKVLGQTYWMQPVDSSLQGSVAMKAMNGHTLIKKYSEEEPIQEITLGIANAFPAWVSSQRSYLLDTANSAWSH